MRGSRQKRNSNIKKDWTCSIKSPVAIAMMMMVPRSFLYTYPSSASPSRQKEQEEHGERSKTRDSLETAAVRGIVSSNKPARIVTAPPSKPSKPVVIPTQTRVNIHHQLKERPVKKIFLLRENNDSRHDPLSLPPAVAAMLAITSLPKSKHNSDVVTRHRNISRLEAHLQEDVGLTILPLSKLSSQSWGTLLNNPNEPEQDNFSFTSDTTLDSTFVRSFSSESMPSLEIDIDSLGSLSNPSTPRIPLQKRFAADRRPKILTSSLSEDCLSEHPLLLISANADYEQEPDSAIDVSNVECQPPETSPPATSRSLLKSNLTAYLRLLKSAAVSISNFTTPVVQRNNYLVSPLLSMSPHFVNARRPLPSMNMPNPALRRYLNPITMSPAELYFHQHQPMSSKCTASIQMQTVYKGKRNSLEATSPPVFNSCKLSLSSDEIYTASFSRQREPRENSDFLRIIVLEMNMRKKGKLADNPPGRARLWLPPRQGLIDSKTKETGIPKRWMGVVL